MTQATGPQASGKRLLSVLNGTIPDRPPVWFMRQAGRYLPEYRETRAEAGSFLDLCYNPKLAAEVTLQPLRRYDLDAAILFADILLLPDALGQSVRFAEGEGPCLEPLDGLEGVNRLDAGKVHEHMAPVYETVDRLSSALPSHVTLIGFAGAPWTVASYMVGGQGNSRLDAARLWAYRHEDAFDRLIGLLTLATGDYLLAQIKAGAEAVQIFDSWSGSLTEDGFRRWCLEPAKALTKRIKAEAPGVPVIGFPKGCGALYEDFVQETGVDGVSIDTGVAPQWARDRLQPHCAVQGNLDPMALVAGGALLREHVAERLEVLGHGRYIFNLGHGIVPHTPPEHLPIVIDAIKAWAGSAPRAGSPSA